jgi:hypothetical protein
MVATVAGAPHAARVSERRTNDEDDGRMNDPG